MPFVAQIDEMDCGAACLGMICRYFGRAVSLTRIREVAHTSVDGTSLRAIVSAAEQLGLAARAVKTTMAQVAKGQTVFETLRNFGEEPTRLVTVPVRAGNSLRAVQVAGSLDDVHSTLKAAAVLFVIMGTVLLVSVGTAGALLTGRVFNAIDDVSTRHIASAMPT